MMCIKYHNQHWQHSHMRKIDHLTVTGINPVHRITYAFWPPFIDEPSTKEIDPLAFNNTSPSLHLSSYLTKEGNMLDFVIVNRIMSQTVILFLWWDDDFISSRYKECACHSLELFLVIKQLLILKNADTSDVVSPSTFHVQVGGRLEKPSIRII